MEYIEFSAKTLDDAITDAKVRLGATTENFEYEVIDKGSSGFLELEAGLQRSVPVRF